MPSFHDIANEGNPQAIITKYTCKLSQKTGRNVIVYYSGWLSIDHDKTAINDYDKNGFMSMINDLDKSKGLDLILHTPGGSVSATESLIHYLHEIFDDNIRAIVPQLAMSGGTMIACSCKEIIMGKQSSLGPIDPQMQGLPAHAILEEFEKAKEEINQNPHTIPLWQPIIAKYPPTFIGECDKAIKWSEEILMESLKRSMFKNEENMDKKIEKIVEELGSHEVTKAHDRHITAQKCKKMGLNIVMMEEDDKLQDLILSIHHACMNYFNSIPSMKLFFNSNGKSMIQKISKD